MHKKRKSELKSENNFDISSTGDVKTNDFDLDRDKPPAISTVRAQIKTVQKLMAIEIKPARNNYDRLKMSVNLRKYEEYIKFGNFRLEDAENPDKPPAYQYRTNIEILEKDSLKEDCFKEDEETISDEDIENFVFDFELEDWDAEILSQTSSEVNQFEDEEDSITLDTKKQVPYKLIKDFVGLNNIAISRGYLIIDITGKWMARKGFLGGLNKDNIREVIEDIKSLKIIDFDVDRFLEVAQIFVCDVFVDLILNSEKQTKNYINGISSFFPLVSNRYNIGKYGYHGLQITPKAKNKGHTFSIYVKSDELRHSYKRRTRAVIYTEMIGYDGEELAKKVLRFEKKLYALRDIRKYLGIDKEETGVVKLSDVLNSTQPVIYEQVEKFAGKLDVLLSTLRGLTDTQESTEASLCEIFIAERFTEILAENDFDIDRTRSHILTEYTDISDSELEKFNGLANIRRNIITFLTYKKPKSVTIMLDVLCKLLAYYNTGMEGIN